MKELTEEVQDLTRQLREENTAKRNSKPSIQPNNNITHRTTEVPLAKPPDVIIFHDSICKGINPTLLSREEVNTKMEFAYTLPQLEEKISKISGVPKVITIHIGTNDITNNSASEVCDQTIAMISRIHELLPNTKIVWSNLVARDDEQQGKVDYVNGAINLRYTGSKFVYVARNSNISITDRKVDRKTKKRIHLKTSGTAKLASTLKRVIAKALGVELKPRSNSYERHTRRP